MQCPQVKGPSALLGGELHNSPVTFYQACNRANVKHEERKKKKQETIKENQENSNFPLQKQMKRVVLKKNYT